MSTQVKADKKMNDSSQFTPRSYQLELMSKAKKKNVIAYLKTGTGKTYIAIMLIKEKSQEIRKPWAEGGKRTFFLVNSVPLVMQQGQYIKDHTDLLIGQYTGSMAVDFWDKNRWETEFETYQVLVMTAQIFLNILNHGFLKLSRVNLVVFDECHHAVKNHPFRKIMELVLDPEFAPPETAPHILGLTASIINKKCKSATIQKGIQSLELAFNSSVETSDNVLDIFRYRTKPKELLYVFNASQNVYQDLLNAHVVPILNEAYENFKNYSARDTRAKECSSDDKVKNELYLHTMVLRQLLLVANECGTLLTLMASKMFVKDVNTLWAKSKEKDVQDAYKYLASVLNSVYTILKPFEADLTLPEVMCMSSTKLITLIKILANYTVGEKGTLARTLVQTQPDPQPNGEVTNGETDNAKAKQHPKEANKFNGIVFVETRYTAILLSSYINLVAKLCPELSFVKSGYIIGHCAKPSLQVSRINRMMTKGQDCTLKQFKMGAINLLISTSIVEEGIDIPKCNLVVRFDMPQNFRSYVQSKGRARAENSYYFLMVENSIKDNFLADLMDYAAIEETLQKRCINREVPTYDESRDSHADQLMPPYQPELGEGKPRVTMTGAVSLVNWYCSRLPSDIFTKFTPKCKTKKIESVNENGEIVVKYQTTLKLPITSVLKMPITGEPMETVKTAQMAAALKCCAWLHKAGELNDHLLPHPKERYVCEREELSETVPEGAPLPGTTKRKQLYCKKVWRDNSLIALIILSLFLHHTSARIEETSHKMADKMSETLTNAMPKAGQMCYLYEFEMILTTPTPPELNTHGRKLYYPERYPKTLGILTTKSLQKIPHFPVYTRSGEVYVKKQLVVLPMALSSQEIEKAKAFHKYLFEKVLRLSKKNLAFNPEKATFNILITILDTSQPDKKCIDWSFMDYVFRKDKEKVPDLKDPNRPKYVFKEEEFVDAVVCPLYRHFDCPLYFFVAEVLRDMNPLSTFPGNYHNTFADYYASKYGIRITNDEQFLLDVDHTVGRLNLLTPRFMTKQGTFLPAASEETKKLKREDINQKQVLIPELCQVHPIPTPLWHKIVCLPAILHRTNYLLICDELRQRLAKEAGLGPTIIPGDALLPDLDFGWKKLCQQQKQQLNTEKCRGKDEPPPKAKSETKSLKTPTAGEKIAQTTGLPTGPSSAHGRKAVNVVQPLVVVPPHRASSFNKANIATTSKSNAKFNGFDTAFGEPDSLETESVRHTILDEWFSRSLKDNKATSVNPKLQKNLNQNKFITFDIDIKGELDDPFANMAEWSSNDIKVSMKPDISLQSPFNAKKQSDDRLDNPYSPRPDKDENGEGNISAALEEALDDDQDYVSIDSLENKDTLDGFDESPNHNFDAEEGDQASSSKEESSDQSDTKNGPKNNSPINVDTENSFLPALYFSQYGGRHLNIDELADNLSVADPPSENSSIFNDNGKRIKTETESQTRPNCQAKLDNGDDDLFGDELDEYEYMDLEQDELDLTNDAIHNGENPDPTSAPKFPPSAPLPFMERDETQVVKTVNGAKVSRCPNLCLILRAITMSTSNDALDLERLELIGDSFLKMAVTVYLFCSEPECHEGKLSYKRSKQVSNFKLYHLGKIRGIGEMIVSTKFEPVENWVAPGFVSTSTPQIANNANQSAPSNEWKYDASKACPEITNAMQYDLRTEQMIPDKCLADCVEALIGAYLISCGARAAMDFMRWLGIQILNSNIDFQAIKAETGETAKDQDASDDMDDIWLNLADHYPPSPLILSTPNYSSKLAKLFYNLESFQNIINYKFNDPAYLIQAFTHSSYGLHRLTDCYQRLEFLGDALLDYLITRHLYSVSDRFTPGQMTDLRSALVNNIIFASLAVKYGFHKYLLQCSPKLFTTIDKFVKVQREKKGGKDTFNMGDNLLLWNLEKVDEKDDEHYHDVEVPKVLGDIFESVAGAIFMDSGMNLRKLWEVYSALMKEEIEYYMTNLPISPIRGLLESEPDRIKFTKPVKLASGQIKVSVDVFGKGRWSGIGSNSKIAKCTAAKTALHHLKDGKKEKS